MANLNNLTKLTKRSLGLTTSNLDTEIATLETRRGNLGGLIYSGSQEVIGAEILKDSVDSFHLKTNASVVGNIRTKTAAEIEDSGVRSATDALGTSFSNENVNNYNNFITNATGYADNSLNLYIDKLLNSGDLVIATETSGGSGASVTFDINGGGTEEGGSITAVLVGELGIIAESGVVTEPGQAISDTAGSLVQAINTYNGNSELGITATLTSTFEGGARITVNFSSGADYIGQTISVTTSGDISAEAGGTVAGESVTTITDATKTNFNKAIEDYKPTFEKLFVEYLPSFMTYQSTLNTELVDFTKLDTEDGVQTLKTGEVLDTFSGFNTKTKAQKTTLTAGFNDSISDAVLSLKEEVTQSNTIIETYGATNLTKEKAELAALEAEYDTIGDLIAQYKDDKNTISKATTTAADTLSKLEASLAGVDTTYITTNSLISIISAASAHTEAIKVYAGKRLDTLIRDAASKGVFSIEVTSLTDIEAKILLDNGYELIESTDTKVSKSNLQIIPTWTISWEGGNSTGE